MRDLLLVIISVISALLGQKYYAGKKLELTKKKNDAIDVSAAESVQSLESNSRDKKALISAEASKVDTLSGDDLANEFDSAFADMPKIDPFEERSGS